METSPESAPRSGRIVKGKVRSPEARRAHGGIAACRVFPLFQGGARLFGRTGLLLHRANCLVLAVPEPARVQAEDHEGRRKLAA
jgi:hypothetical protein